MGPSLEDEGSILHQLYERFMPVTVPEALFDHVDEPLTPLDRLPARHEVAKYSWNLAARTVERLQQQAPIDR